MARFMAWIVIGFVLGAGLAGGPAAQDGPRNWARDARITSDSEYSDEYRAAFVADGIIPPKGTRTGVGEEWAVQGATHAEGARLTFTWPSPVTVAEIVYYGRTSFAVECWNDYEVFVDGAAAPVVGGHLQPGHGPQRITLPSPTPARALTIAFLSAHGGLNPGAAEVQIFSEPPTAAFLGTFEPLPAFRPGEPTDGIPASPVPESAALAAALEAGELGFSQLLVVQRHAYSISHVYTYHAEGFVPGGGIHLFTPGPRGGVLREIFAAGGGEVMDARLSFDGREVLFSHKETDGPPGEQDARNRSRGPDPDPATKYQIYRMNVDGSGLRRLTSGPSNNFNPCWLPDGGIAFLSDRKESFAYCFVTTSPLLYRMDAEGRNVTRLSHGYLNDFTPSVLNDGRLVYSRWEYVDRPAIPIQGLWTMRPDGTGVTGLYGNRVLEPGTFMEARSIGDSRRILCVLTAHNGSCRGAIGVIDPARGANAQDAIRNVTPEIPIGRVDHGNGNYLVNRGPYDSPFPLDEQHFLVSRAGTVLLRDYEGTEQVTLLAPRDGMGFHSAQPLRAVPAPPTLASVLPEDSEPWASVFVADVYDGLGSGVERGEIAEICVVEEIEKSRWAPLYGQVPTCTQYAANSAFGYQFPLVSCGATYAPKKVWGYADVEEDGSASFEVPSGVPLYVLALDAEGRAVQRMRTFVHFQPGERRSCVGCHADPSQTAARADSARGLAAQRAPHALRAPEWGRVNFSYPDIVQPVLDEHCVRCHHVRDAQGGVDLSGDKTDFFNVSYDVLARTGTHGAWHPETHDLADLAAVGESPFVKWISSINGAEANILMIEPRTWGSPASVLADLVLRGHPDDEGVPRVDVDRASKRRLLAWMDLNVPYYDNSVSNHYDRMGCRRLLPPDLDAVLQDVQARRCIDCHAAGIPRSFYTRVTNVEENPFLSAPLAEAAGGRGLCGPVFQTRDDPDYQAILRTFAPIHALLEERPRLDMPGAVLVSR